MRRNWRARLSVVLLVLALIAVACGDDDDDGAGGATGGEFEGKTVTIAGAFIDAEATNFEASINALEDRTGIDVEYEGSKDFTEQLAVRVEAGDPPDIAMLPQPGRLLALAEEGELMTLDGTPVADAIAQNYEESAADIGRGVDGKLYGVWYKAAVKSLVWYPVEAFEAAGYEVPATWDDLMALTEKIAADGKTPWCIGIEAGGDTGWVATDWTEDLMLRLHGPDVYDQWWQHEIPFNDAKVKQAVEMWSQIWLNDKFVRGGKTNILTEAFGDAPNPLFEDEPGCFLHRQANFILDFFPEDATVGPDGDVNFFHLPPIDPAQGMKPTLVAGDIAVTFENRPEVLEVMEFLATPESGEAWAKSGGYLAPHKTFDVSNYGDDTTRQFGELLTQADVIRYDGSDLMPAEVGAGSFWSGMVELVRGKSVDEALADIEQSWPD
jgi:alpha-glucoside transport system substrate-binding protein